ncbi:MAG: hypothetical protein LBQ70_02680 [Prevotellaceae bacterium]|jgi:hypothetical protein|nr:hypothetical protein [Prevotellaceae bacterium]
MQGIVLHSVRKEFGKNFRTGYVFAYFGMIVAEKISELHIHTCRLRSRVYNKIFKKILSNCNIFLVCAAFFVFSVAVAKQYRKTRILPLQIAGTRCTAYNHPLQIAGARCTAYNHPLQIAGTRCTAYNHPLQIAGVFREVHEGGKPFYLILSTFSFRKRSNSKLLTNK